MARSLNRVQLIGNLTRDPELRYTPSGTAVCTFSVATNRSWKTESGDTRDEAEFHRIVSWDKLAEICSQLLKRGTRAYVEGRLQTRKWQTKEGQDRQTTEIVISEMMVLDRATAPSGDFEPGHAPENDFPEDFDKEPESHVAEKTSKKSEKPAPKKAAKGKAEASEDDIPF